MGPVRYEVENLTDEVVRQVLSASRRLINGVGFLLCSAALWAYHNSRSLLPESLITGIAKFGADRLESKRIAGEVSQSLTQATRLMAYGLNELLFDFPYNSKKGDKNFLTSSLVSKSL